ncbi:hypothetical protein BDF21DRAFT_430460 [Thamnidium elegans]|nr:hypothetical protein BDF21DRAFT_430460 [Thamnidium elegans]
MKINNILAASIKTFHEEKSSISKRISVIASLCDTRHLSFLIIRELSIICMKAIFFMYETDSYFILLLASYLQEKKRKM